MSEFAIDDEEAVFGRVDTPSSANLTFAPWHRPRKQWVRVQQWGQAVDRLLGGSSYSSTNTVHYFGFPGQDCLDLRVLGEVVGTHGKQLRFFGVEQSAAAAPRAQYVVESVMKDLPYIDKLSKIEPSQFELLCGAKSKLTNDVMLHDPFNIVNLDFMNCVLPPGVGKDRLAAILQMLEFQFNRQYKPWLLFLTTRCDRDSVCSTNIDDLTQVLENNIEQHSEFKASLNDKILGLDAGADINLADHLNNPLLFSSIFSMSILKWILHKSVSSGVKLKMKKMVTYTVSGEDAPFDMVSIVIEFIKCGNVNDPTGVAAPVASAGNDLELMTALTFAEKVSSSTNVDVLMRDDSTLKDTLADATKSMLDRLGYNIENYPAYPT